jgi:hypothetical protein
MKHAEKIPLLAIMSKNAAVYADAMRLYGVTPVAHWMRVSGCSLALALQAVRLANAGGF